MTAAFFYVVAEVLAVGPFVCDLDAVAAALSAGIADLRVSTAFAGDARSWMVEDPLGWWSIGQ